MTARGTKPLRRLSALRITNRVFAYYNRKIVGRRALSSGDWLPRVMESLFSLTPIHNVSGIHCRGWLSPLLTRVSAPCRVTQKLVIYAPSSRAVRRLNTRADSIWIGGRTTDG